MTVQTAFKIGWRNIWRSRRRSILTMLAVAFAAAILVFFISLQLSSYDTSINATVGIFHGHLQVQHPQYLKQPQMRHSIAGVQHLLKEILDLGEVAGAAPRASAFALISSGKRSYGAQIVGVNFDLEKSVSNIPSLIVAGSFLDQHTAYEAVIGKLLAKNLAVSAGDELTLLGQGKDGSLAAAVLVIKGIFESGSREVDRSMVQLPLDVFREIFSMPPDEAHALVVRAERLDLAENAQAKISGMLPGAKRAVVVDWEQLLPGLKQSIELDMASGWLFYLSLVVVVTFTVLNTFLMAVLERTREFGVMLALGTRARSIAGLIFIECAMLTALGNLLGAACGAMIVAYFGVTGFSIPGTEEILKQWNLPSAIHPSLSPAALSIGPLVLTAAALISIVYPICKIFHLSPVEAMRHV